MSGTTRPRPRRKIRHELLAILYVFLIPSALVAVFPFEAATFEPGADAEPSAPSCAFVELDDAAEARALARAKSMFATGDASAGRIRADLAHPTVPAPAPERVSSFADRARPRPPALFRPANAVMPPSVAAPPPEDLPSAGAEEPAPPAFPREELLEMKRFGTKKKGEVSP